MNEKNPKLCEDAKYSGTALTTKECQDHLMPSRDMPPGIVVNLRGFFVKPEPPNILIYPQLFR